MNPLDRVLDALRAQGCEPRESGGNWTARCPAHDDENPSLSVSEGEDGRALVHCHAGCGPDAICESLDLFPAELFLPSTNPAKPSTKRPRNPGHGGFRRRRQEESPHTRHATAQDAIGSLESSRGPCDDRWSYEDRDGREVGWVVRWHAREGKKKEIRPVSRRDDGWAVEGMHGPRPLYRLQEVIEAETVYVVEGEKTADAARSIGLTATTSAGGSSAPSKADWSVLAGKEVVILPDNDEAGRKYAAKVCGVLTKLAPPARVRVVHLDNHIDGAPLEKGDDLVEWIEGHGDSATPEMMAANLAEIVERTPYTTAVSGVRLPLMYQPFPVGALPEPLREYVCTAAEAIGCDEAYVALPLLSSLASAIGSTRRLRLKKGWEPPAILWTCIIGESGTSKTPAFDAAMRFVKVKEAALQTAYAEACEQYQEQRLIYEKQEKQWKSDKKDSGPPPEEPVPPTYLRAAFGDATIEALAPLLKDNPRGLLLQLDELAGWFGLFDRYAAKAGGDVPKWLSMYSGEGFSVDRKTGIPRTIYVHQAYVSVTGGIQPGILVRVLGKREFDSGLAARMLFAWPPRRVPRWTEATIDQSAERAVEFVFEKHYALEHQESDRGPQPRMMTLSSQAKRAWVGFYNAHTAEEEHLESALAAAWSKLRELPARLALVLYCVEDAAQAGVRVDEMWVEEHTVRDAITLTEWFKRETRRVYEQLETDEDLQQVLADYEWIDQRDG